MIVHAKSLFAGVYVCVYIRVHTHMYVYIYIYLVTPSPPYDPPEPSCQLFVYNTMSPNAFSEVHKPSVFARAYALHIY